MEKPILITNIDGVLLEKDVFYEPHKDWFKRAIKKTDNPSLKEWIGHKHYFIGVGEAMEQILPNSSPKERTLQARKWYQEDVINYIKTHPETIKTDIAKKLKSLKEKYKLILLTTNSKDYINQILKAANLENIYDGILASETEKAPSKEKLIDELIQKHGNPKYYLSGKPEKEIIEKFKSLSIEVLNLEDLEKL